MRRLQSIGVSFTAINLEPVFESIDRYNDIIEAAVSRLEAATGGPVVLVGHSMGGLAVRAWLSKHGHVSRVHRVITVGTPHNGTWFARYARSINGRQMRLNSDWLQAIAQRETDEQRALYTCFYSLCDNIVFPPTSAMLRGAKNLQIHNRAHMHMLSHPDVFAEVAKWISSGRSSRTN